MKTWIGIIFLSTIAFMTFANVATRDGMEGVRPQMAAALDLDKGALEAKARGCAEGKRDALRRNDTARYIELVTDLSCHQAELVVFGE